MSNIQQLKLNLKNTYRELADLKRSANGTHTNSREVAIKVVEIMQDLIVNVNAIVELLPKEDQGNG